MSLLESSPIAQALTKKYEQRTKNQHNLLLSIIAPLFPTLTINKLKLITFYLDISHNTYDHISKTYPPNSFILIFNQHNNPEFPVKLHYLRGKQIRFQQNDVVAVLSIDKYLNVGNLGETTIQEELQFWQSSQYFCSMSKKKFLKMIKNAQIIHFNENQCAYIQGQLITQKQSGSGIYVIRNGQFGYYKSNKNKQIETNTFKQGHIFGVLELLNNQSAVRHRVMTAKCKTSKAIVYHFSEEFFNQHIRQFNEHIIRNKQAKLLRFLPQVNKQDSNFILNYKANFSDNNTVLMKKRLSLKNDSEKEIDFLKTERKVFPTIRLQEMQRATSTSLYNKSVNQLSQNIKSNLLGQTSSIEIKKNGPLKNYPLISQTSNFTTSEFRDLDKIVFPDQTKNSKEKILGCTQNGVWKRDLIFSFYRQNLYKKTQSHRRRDSANNEPMAY